jgi:hypothetical protein
MAGEEVGLAVAATALVASPRARKVLRRGVAYGLAGALKAGDVVVGTTRGAARGAQDGLSRTKEQGDTGDTSPPVSAQAPTPAPAATT